MRARSPRLTRRHIWAILEPTVRAGETFALPRDRARRTPRRWTGSGRAVFVAEVDSRAVGTYFLRGNQLGGGDHVANCAYITDMALRGRGIARRLAEHSLEEPRRRGFLAMQFNSWSAPTRAPCTCGRASGSNRWPPARRLPGPPPRPGRLPRHVPYARLVPTGRPAPDDGTAGVTNCPARISPAAWHCSHP